ncbi:polysaccharide deacetylase family protein [Microlunatus flavus]|uniref:Polysaccharide deacetylase n=1 Tax=Microlunatus flavus TaxID=1036181 RepID=A0A1H8ZCE1_9ACTN|nr:polysaccharide deacetylase family protein [Microlunatus flavus]SEP61837.1 Polysaccharide deacetylase [Microlunatus flavus]
MPLRDRVPRGLKDTVRRAAGVVGSVEAVRTQRPELVLTFDDGPDPVGTPAVLEALAAHDATATFFVLLTRVRRHPELLARVRAAGHEVALHGVDHARLTHLPPAEVRARTAAAKAELEALTGEAVRWFRPPYGAQTPATWLAVRRAGMVPVLWGPTTWDWRDVTQEERVAKARQGARAGAVVLAHDAFADESDGAEAPDGPLRAPSVDRGDLVDRVLTAYAAEGLRARSLGDALASGAPVRAARFRR